MMLSKVYLLLPFTNLNTLKHAKKKLLGAISEDVGVCSGADGGWYGGGEGWCLQLFMLLHSGALVNRRNISFIYIHINL